LSRPDGLLAASIAALPGIPLGAEGPVFREPWEAQAFAMAVQLNERGIFTWSEWAAALAAEIKSAQAAGDPDTGATYYHHWLAALERLATAKALTGTAELATRRAQWERAALATPHGQPIALANDPMADDSPSR
jgi:nitrile hydratase accessory protein